jgi:predicted transcriptional regulator
MDLDVAADNGVGAVAEPVEQQHQNHESFGIIGGIICGMPMTLRLSDDEADALRRRAELESRSMQEVARQAIREYVETHSRQDLLDQVLDAEIPRYAEALRRLGE